MIHADVFDEDVCDVLTASDLAEKGCWPVAGGWLNQTSQTLDGVRLVWGLRSQCERAVEKRYAERT